MRSPYKASASLAKVSAVPIELPLEIFLNVSCPSISPEVIIMCRSLPIAMKLGNIIACVLNMFLEPLSGQHMTHHSPKPMWIYVFTISY